MTYKKGPVFEHVQRLSLPLSLIKGVGPKRAALFGLKGLNAVLDLFYFTPVRYEDRSTVTPISRVEDGCPCLVKGRVTEGKEEIFYPSRKRLYRINISGDDGERLELLWFHYIRQHLASFSRTGITIMVYGTVKISRGKRQMFHPDISIPGHGCNHAPGFIPVYSSIKGVSENITRAVIRTCMDNYLADIIDPVPSDLLNQLHLPGLRESIKGIHSPPQDSSMELLNRSGTPFHKRLLFDRFFHLMLGMAFRKRMKECISKPVYFIPQGFRDEIKGFFKFSLTSDQDSAINDIAGDLKSGRPMNRMLMGDVGTGKTAVAAVAAYVTVLNRRQAAIMAPTQILAEQHMDYFVNLPGNMGFRPVLITGDIKKTERRKVYQKIKEREYNIIIGTQSLIQEELIFADLGLAIIDEQHRFGVRQMALMDRKGDNPHILVMTATPIPRSMAITLYGDMDISVIKEYPKDRRPVKTCLIDKTRKRWAFETLKQNISSGRQAFVICPVIEDNEDVDLKGAREMHDRLKKTLSPACTVGIVHGQMPADEREAVMHSFYRGLIDILVATTVVEVGVHVPNATIMIIEHPERFGLAQLHQLRGRVGRGTEEGMCMMILPDNLAEKAEARLKILAESRDGFEISEKDLELRGHGELMGLRQSGIGELDPSEIIRHQALLLAAKRCARDLIQADPDLSHHDHRYLRMIMESISGSFLDS